MHPMRGHPSSKIVYVVWSIIRCDNPRTRFLIVIAGDDLRVPAADHPSIPQAARLCTKGKFSAVPDWNPLIWSLQLHDLLIVVLLDGEVKPHAVMQAPYQSRHTPHLFVTPQKEHVITTTGVDEPKSSSYKCGGAVGRSKP